MADGSCVGIPDRPRVTRQVEVDAHATATADPPVGDFEFEKSLGATSAQQFSFRKRSSVGAAGFGR